MIVGLSFLFQFTSFAQSVGINEDGTLADPSALLDVKADDKGLLIPRMTAAQRESIPNPATSLMVFQTDANPGYYYFDGQHWQIIGNKGGGMDALLQNGRKDTTAALPTYTIGTFNITDTSGILYDSGGATMDYSNNEDLTTYLEAPANAIAVKIRILNYQTESPYDSLFIRVLSSPEQGIYSFYGTGSDVVLPLLTQQNTSTSGKVRIQFQSNGFNTGQGFELRWDWIFLPTTAPQAIPNTGWHFDPTKLAMRGGANIGNTWASDSLGVYSLAWGRRATAIGSFSIAFGESCRALKYSSFAAGYRTLASGNNSIAMGRLTKATGYESIAVGNTTLAGGTSSVAMGYYTNATGSYSTALGYQTLASGYISTALGYLNTASGYGSVAMGSNTIASEDFAVAMGDYTQASGRAAIACGRFTNAYGSNSAAFGSSSDALGTSTAAFGINTTAKGKASTSLGSNTQSNGYSSIVVGVYNDTIIGSQLTVSPSTPLFIIGNGNSNTSRSNALIVRKDGKVGIGTNAPLELLQVGNSTGDAIQVGSFEKISDEGSLIMGVNSNFIPTSDNSYDLGSASNRWDDIWATNGTIQTSDINDKHNINELSYGLDEVLQLRPVSYQWKSGADQAIKLGLIAQDVQQVLPEVVRTSNFVTQEDGTLYEEPTTRLGMNYAALTPVMIKAVHELAAANAEMKKENDGLRQEMKQLKGLLENLQSAVEQTIQSEEASSSEKDVSRSKNTSK